MRVIAIAEASQATSRPIGQGSEPQTDDVQRVLLSSHGSQRHLAAVKSIEGVNR